MIKLFKIPAFLLAFSIILAPYVSLVSHAVVHRLFVFEHHNVHGDHADQAQPQSQGNDHDHVVTIDSLSPAPVVSLAKLQVPARKVSDGSAAVLKISILNDRKISQNFIGEAPPPLIEQFIALSLHPTNAPPLR